VKSKNSKLVTNPPYQYSIVLSGAALVTLIFNSKIQDPFNAPKFFVLILLASWTLGILIVYKIANLNNYNIKSKILAAIILVFLASSLISALKADDLFTSFVGENMRRTGFITYSCLVIIFIYFTRVTTTKNIHQIVIVSTLIGLTDALYGLMQITDNDFVRWSNPYNKIITTLGNPNFAAASLAIFAAISLAALVFLRLSKVMTIVSIISISLSLMAILLSDARQGLLSFIAGAFFVLFTYVYERNRKLSMYLAGAIGIIFCLTILALMQIGPLTNLIYKGSISVRGYYWRAGISMFKDNFFFGVGLDSYQKYFKLYRTPDYALTFGYEITSSNAHNVPIQFFATGGVFLGVSYLALSCLVFFVGIKSIFFTQIESRKFVVPVFSGWLVYQTQSFVSIDSLGLAIWGWLLGGAVLGVAGYSSHSESKFTLENSRKDLKSIQIILSTVLVILPIYCVSQFQSSESNMLNARVLYDPKDLAKRDAFYKASKEVADNKFSEPFYRYQISTFLITNGFAEEGFKILDMMILQEPTNLDYLNSRAGFFEQLGKYEKAIADRKVISAVDPWNARNYLQMGINYKNLGEFEKMKLCLDKITEFNTVDSIYLEAKRILIE
jgi:O-antigen ligase